MSFSSDIKEIICKTEYNCPCCRRAELAGFFIFTDKADAKTIRINTTVAAAAERIKKALFEELEITSDDGVHLNEKQGEILRASLSDEDIINECCGVSYLRGAFLGAGFISDPERGYHLEFDTKSVKEAQFMLSLLENYGFKPKAARRRDKKIIYIKESSQIADIIGYLTGGKAGLEIFSIQVEKELNSTTQRLVNCDSANLGKLAAASAKQIAAIKKIKAAGKWSLLPDVLTEIGDLRMEYPDESLEALGKKTKTEIGKSGVNHRLKRIIDYADSLSVKEGEVK